MKRTRMAAALAAAAMAVGVAAAPASAQPQTGLVNVDISGNTIQVPVAVAANLCGTTVAVLVQDLRNGPVQCDADAQADAVGTGTGGGGGGPQEGLVNLRVSDNTVQVPITAAANICGTTVAVLAEQIENGAVTCDAQARGSARD